MKASPLTSLIDPTAAVINRHSSVRSIRLIHRALLSHIQTLGQARSLTVRKEIEDESFEVEYDSTVQLCSDIEAFLKIRKDA